MIPFIALASLSLLGYHLTFDAEMNSASDMSQFYNTFVNGDTSLSNNGEAESYVSYNPGNPAVPYSFQNGALVINATPIPSNNLPYTSGMIETGGIYSQTGGYFEIRAMTPAAPGFWPAFWMLPYSWYPEIDVLEQPNNEGVNTQYWTHTSTASDSSGGWTDTGVDVTTGFHTYGFLWTPTTIQYVFDGQLTGTPHVLPPSMVGLQMYMIANLAVGGAKSWPGPPPAGASSSYTIDYVRAYSNDPGVPSVSQEPMSSPDGVNTLPLLTPPAPPVPAPVGQGADTLVVDMAEDAGVADAQFTVSVDGRQCGGVMTAQAAHAFGQTQPFTIHGNYGLARHQVTVNFLNAAPAVSGAGNLYVTGATLNGQPVGAASLEASVSGPHGFGFTARGVQPVTIGTGADVLLFSISNTPHTRNGRFGIMVDGVAQGGVQVVVAQHGYGQTQSFAVHGNFGPAAHQVTLVFRDGAADASGPDPVDLYVDALSYDGIAVPSAQLAMSVSGKYTIQTPPQQADTLSVSLNEDAWQGDAVAQVSVDGLVIGTTTVTASYYYGPPQVMTYSGNWGGPNVPHTVTVNYLNDLYTGPGQDRNLHVENITLDGTAVTRQGQNVMRAGPVGFAYPVPAAGAGWVFARL